MEIALLCKLLTEFHKHTCFPAPPGWAVKPFGIRSKTTTTAHHLAPSLADGRPRPAKESQAWGCLCPLHPRPVSAPPLPWGLLPGKQIHKPVTTSSSIQQVPALSPWPLINISSFSLPLRPGSHTPGGVCNTGRLFPAQVLKYQHICQGSPLFACGSFA